MKKILFLVILLTALVLTACGGGDDIDAVATLDSVPSEFSGLANPLGEDAIIEGANIYKTNCETCHGVQGHGDGPAGAALDPRPKNLAELQAIAGDDYLYWRINTGKEGTSMVAWTGMLNDEQIWKVVAFINTLK